MTSNHTSQSAEEPIEPGADSYLVRVGLVDALGVQVANRLTECGEQLELGGPPADGTRISECLFGTCNAGEREVVLELCTRFRTWNDAIVKLAIAKAELAMEQAGPEAERICAEAISVEDLTAPELEDFHRVMKRIENDR